MAGSIWALVPHEPDPATVAELERTAAVVALHLLQLRSQADLSRRVAQGPAACRPHRRRRGCRGVDPAGPWRVVALTSTDAREEAQEVGRRLDQWEAVLRRQSWPEPRLTSVADRAFALVRDDGAGRPTQKSPPAPGPGCSGVVDALAQQGSSLVAGAGAPALTPSDLPRSLAQAQAVGRVVRAGTAPGPACTVEQAWAPITLDRVGRTIGEGILPRRSTPSSPSTSRRGPRTQRPWPRGWTTAGRRAMPPTPSASTPTPCATAWDASWRSSTPTSTTRTNA